MKLGDKVRQALICRAADHRRGLPAGKKGYRPGMISQACEVKVAFNFKGRAIT